MEAARCPPVTVISRPALGARQRAASSSSLHLVGRGAIRLVGQSGQIGRDLPLVALVVVAPPAHNGAGAAEDVVRAESKRPPGLRRDQSAATAADVEVFAIGALHALVLLARSSAGAHLDP